MKKITSYWTRTASKRFFYGICEDNTVLYFLDDTGAWEISTLSRSDMYSKFERWTVAEVIESGFLDDPKYRMLVLQELV